jgi:hypothetical protein
VATSEALISSPTCCHSIRRLRQLRSYLFAVRYWQRRNRPVTFESPCECRDNHGEHRWAVKNDPSNPPADASAIQAVTPSDVFSWPGPAEHLTQSSERTGIENNWFALTRRVVAVKVEMDGDLHVALQDATGDKAGIVVCEIPAKQQWCSIRETVFSWMRARFPFHTGSAKNLTLDQTPVVTVTGGALIGCEMLIASTLAGCNPESEIYNLTSLAGS